MRSVIKKKIISIIFLKGSKKNGNEQNFHFRHIDGAGRGTINGSFKVFSSPM